MRDFQMTQTQQNFDYGSSQSDDLATSTADNERPPAQPSGDQQQQQLQRDEANYD